MPPRLISWSSDLRTPGARDVEVGPGHLPDELAQEQAGEHSPGPRSRADGDVGQVGHRGAEGRPVVLDERQAPHPLTRGSSCDLEAGGEPLVGGEQRRVPAAERDPDRTGQGRQVDHGVRPQAAHGVGQGVSEDQPTLRVGVEHLDGGAAVLGEDVAGPLGAARRHVLGQREEAGDPDLDVERAERAEHREHRGRPGHVGLHRGHRRGRLDRDPAGVERDALADQHHVRQRRRTVSPVGRRARPASAASPSPARRRSAPRTLHGPAPGGRGCASRGPTHARPVATARPSTAATWSRTGCW